MAAQPRRHTALPFGDPSRPRRLAKVGATDRATATAYSLGQQLAVTAWNVAFALVVVVWAFGWTGGKLLVAQSYADDKVKAAEQKAQRAARKDEKRAAEDTG